MYKATNDSMHMRARAGSFSTRASARGVNLLGWDKLPEVLTREQELAVLLEVRQLLQNRLTHEALTSDDRKELGKQYADVEFRRAHLTKGEPRKRNIMLDRMLVEVACERLPRAEWRAIVAEAHRRMEATNPDWDRRPAR